MRERGSDGEEKRWDEEAAGLAVVAQVTRDTYFRL